MTGLLESIDPPGEIIVYVCPTSGCGNHYASPRFRPDQADISSPQERHSQNEGGGRLAGPARQECPDCRTRGIKAVRVPYIVTAVVPLADVLKKVRSG